MGRSKLLFVTLITGYASIGAQEPAPLELKTQEVRLSDDRTGIVERGILEVPLIRSDPNSRMVGVEIVRFPAAEGAPDGVPPVMLLNGGPGFTGLPDPISTAYYEDQIERFTALTDIVVVGQRGIGSSPPNTVCGGYEPPPLDEEISDEEEVARVRDACARCREHWEAQGYDLTGFNVLEAAADVRDVAAALGYDQVTLWGGSFGSHWGMAIIRTYPEIVARAVLTGMEGPDHTYDMPSWVLAALQRMAKAVEATPEFEGLIPEGGLLAGFEAAIQRVEAEPLMLDVRDPRSRRAKTVRISADLLRGMALGVRGRVSSRRGMPSWPADLLEIARGDYTAAAQSALRNNDGGLPTASFFMLDCGSGISPERLAILQADPGAKIVGRLGAFYESACPTWGSDLGEDFRSGFETDVPTVIVQGDWDTSTPFENALELAPMFKRSKFVVVHGGSHGAMGEALDESGEFSEALWEFILSGDMADIPGEVELPPINWVLPKEEE